MLRVFRIPIRLKWKFLIGILDLVLLFGAIHIYLVKMHLGKSLQQEPEQDQPVDAVRGTTFSAIGISQDKPHPVLRLLFHTKKRQAR